MLRGASRDASRTISTFTFAALSILGVTGCAVGLGAETLAEIGDPKTHVVDGTPLPTLGSSSGNSSSQGHVSSSSSSSSGGGTCDASNDCSTCGNCSLAALCEPPMTACETDPSCSALLDCLSTCADQTCADDCAAQNPDGQAGYMALVTCVLCDACPVSCGGESMGACGP